MHVQSKFEDTWAAAGRLKTPRQLAVRAQLQRLYQLANGSAYVGGGQWEWDLKLANELDKIYQATATEARNVANVAAATAAKVGFGFWPLAIAFVAIAWAVKGKR